LALRVVLLEADAEEVVQDVFVSLYRNIDDFQGRCAFSSWIYRITYNCALMKMRSFKRRLRREQQSIGLGCCNTEDLCPTVEEHFINRESLGLARDIVDSLPESFKAIFWLRDISGLSGAETAEMLGLSPAAVKSRLHRARAMIRKKGVFFF
jgi:RNA polymerase sigma-70 factor (ECF subfamily)